MGDTIATGGGPPPESLTPAEELALSLNRGHPLVEGIEGGTSSDVLPQGVREKYVQGILTAIPFLKRYQSLYGKINRPIFQ